MGAQDACAGRKAHLKFMDEAYEKALTMYPVLIGLTKQSSSITSISKWATNSNARSQPYLTALRYECIP